jgi:hypothetical protein
MLTEDEEHSVHEEVEAVVEELHQLQLQTQQETSEEQEALSYVVNASLRTKSKTKGAQLFSSPTRRRTARRRKFNITDWMYLVNRMLGYGYLFSIVDIFTHSLQQATRKGELLLSHKEEKQALNGNEMKDSMMSRKRASMSVTPRCAAARKDGQRCKYNSFGESGLCKSHAHSVALQWNDDVPAPALTPAVAIQTSRAFGSGEDTEKKEIRLPHSLNVIILQKNAVGQVMWPGTPYMVKSLQEPFVIARKIGDVEFVALDSRDTEYLQRELIPFKQIDIQFHGVTQPPKSILQQALSGRMLPSASETAVEGLKPVVYNPTVASMTLIDSVQDYDSLRLQLYASKLESSWLDCPVQNQSSTTFVPKF